MTSAYCAFIKASLFCSPLAVSTAYEATSWHIEEHDINLLSDSVNACINEMPVKERCFPSHFYFFCSCLRSSSHSRPRQDDSLAFTVWPFLLCLVFVAGHRGCSKGREMNPNAAASLAGCDGTGERSQVRCRRGPGSRARPW